MKKERAKMLNRRQPLMIFIPRRFLLKYHIISSLVSRVISQKFKIWKTRDTQKGIRVKTW